MGEKTLCLRCVAADMLPEYSLWDRTEMVTSDVTSDLICPHCKIVEVEQGYEKMGMEEIKYVGKKFEEYEKILKQKGLLE